MTDQGGLGIKVNPANGKGKRLETAQWNYHFCNTQKTLLAMYPDHKSK
jgi:hypothetical protein